MTPRPTNPKAHNDPKAHKAHDPKAHKAHDPKAHKAHDPKAHKAHYLTPRPTIEDAILCYEKALEIDPRDATRWFNKAFSEDEIGRAAAAVRSYTQFLELASPQHARQVVYASQKIAELNNR